MTLRDTSKRVDVGKGLALAALCLTFALVSPSTAKASSLNVEVTARISESFSMTAYTNGVVSFGNVKPGKRYDTPKIQLLRITSSRPWMLTDSSDTVIKALGGKDRFRPLIVGHEPSVRFDRVKSAGIYDITCSYWLDLRQPWTASLPTGTNIVTRMGYTAVQQ
jgi:hypothetical protein